MFTKPKVYMVTSTPENDYACLEVACTCCDEAYLFGVALSGVQAWQNGAFVQDAFPELPKQYREMLISGTCPECWTNMFGSGTDPGDFS